MYAVCFRFTVGAGAAAGARRVAAPARVPRGPGLRAPRRARAQGVRYTETAHVIADKSLPKESSEHVHSVKTAYNLTPVPPKGGTC